MLALGAVPRTVPVPGLAEHGLPFKTLADAIHLRNSVLRELEAADAALDDAERRRRLTFVFVGAGYAGVEALAELSDLVEDALRFYPGLHGVPRRWVLVDAAPRILPEIPSRLGEYAANELAGRGVEIHVGTTLESVSRRRGRAGGRDADPGAHARLDGGRRARIRCCASWECRSTTAAGSRWTSFSGCADSEHVWSLGDCARVPNTRTDRPDPPTCQHALRQARRLARNLQGSPEPYGYRMLGQVATLGRYKGIADVLGLRLRGFPGWWVTRSYHLYQLPLLQRKLRVVVDWTTSLLFRRDIVELGQLGHPEKLG